MIGDYEGPMVPINPYKRVDDCRGCLMIDPTLEPSAGIGAWSPPPRNPRRDAPPPYFLEARKMKVRWGKFAGRTIDEIARTGAGLKFLVRLRPDDIPDRHKPSWSWKLLRAFLAYPPVNRAVEEISRRPS